MGNFDYSQLTQAQRQALQTRVQELRDIDHPRGVIQEWLRGRKLNQIRVIFNDNALMAEWIREEMPFTVKQALRRIQFYRDIGDREETDKIFNVGFRCLYVVADEPTPTRKARLLSYLATQTSNDLHVTQEELEARP